MKNRLPRDFKWKVQLAERKNKKEKVMEKMLMGIRKGIEVIEKGRKEEIEGIIMKMVEIWRKNGRRLGAE